MVKQLTAKTALILLMIVTLVVTMTPVQPQVFADTAEDTVNAHVKISVNGDEKVTLKNFTDNAGMEDRKVKEKDEFDVAKGSSFDIVTDASKEGEVKVSEEGEISKKADGEYSLKVNGDTDVTVSFDNEKEQKKDKRDAAKENASKEQKEEKAVDDKTTAENDGFEENTVEETILTGKKEKKIIGMAMDSYYIANHINPKYVNTIYPDAFNDPITYARAAAAYTIKGGDELEEGKQGSNILASVNYVIAIYDVDPDGKYYVAIANVDKGNSEPFATDIVYNNDNGEYVKGAFTDDSIVYIPKDAIDDPNNKKDLFDEEAPIAIQTSYAVGKEMDFSKEIPVVVAGTEGDDLAAKTVRISNMFDTYLEVPVAEAGSTYSESDFIVTINGNTIPLDSSQYAFDRATGNILIRTAPATTSSVAVLIKKQSAARKILGAISDDAYAMAAKDVVALKNDTTKKNVILYDSKTDIYNNMPVGWRGYYGKADVAGNYTCHYNTKEANLKSHPWYTTSRNYVYAGSTKDAAWALMSYTRGKNVNGDKSLGSNNGGSAKYGADLSPTGAIKHKYEYGAKKGKTVTQNIGKWFDEFRASIIGVKSGNASLDTKSNSKHAYIRDKTKKTYSQGALTFAFKMPKKLHGLRNLKTTGESKDFNLTISNMDADAAWLAAWCRHFGNAKSQSGDQKESGNMFVSCLNKVVEGNNKYVILAFTYQESVGSDSDGSQTPGAIYKFQVKETPPPTPSKGFIQIYKTDEEKQNEEGYDPKNLFGAKFSVTNSTTNAAYTLEIDRTKSLSDGKIVAASPAIEVPLGTYKIKETAAPTSGNYTINTSTFTKAVASGSTATSPVTVTVNEKEKPGWLKIKKVSADPEATEGNPNYDLEGAKFQVLDGNGTVITSMKTESGDTVSVLTTDKNGVTEKVQLPSGEYSIRETEASKGFKVIEKNVVADINGGDTEVIDIEEPAEFFPLKLFLQKIDSGTGTEQSEGEASIQGAEFTVKFYPTSEKPGETDTPQYTWVLATDGDGKIKYDEDYQIDGDPLCQDENGKYGLPHGWVSIQETGAPEGYIADEEIYFYEAGELASIEDENVTTIIEKPIRGDFKFTKLKGKDKDRFANIPFLVEGPNNEKHIFVTDANGEFDSSLNIEEETNGNDWYEKSPTSGTLDSSKGIWFYGTEDPDDGMEPTDSEGALPYGNYTIKELRCDENKGYRLIDDVTFEITKDDQQQKIDLGGFTNYESFKTSMVEEGGDKVVLEGESTTLVDTITYHGLVAGKQYAMSGKLMVKETGSPLVIDGKEVTVNAEPFTPEGTPGEEVDGTTTVTYTLSTKGLSGKHLVSYEKMYEVKDEQKRLIDTHENLYDVDQTVEVINPHYTMYKIRLTDAPKKLDTEDYTYTTPNDNERHGPLYGFNKGDTVLYKVYIVNDGDMDLKMNVSDAFEDSDYFTQPKIKNVNATDWINEGADDYEAQILVNKGTTATVTYEAKVLTDKEYLAANKADSDTKNASNKDCNYRDKKNTPDDDDGYVNTAQTTDVTYDGGELDDLDDVAQTPVQRARKIGTTLTSLKDNKTIPAINKATLKDTVAYEGLVPGNEYTMKGTLYEVENGAIKGGAIATAEQKFTPNNPNEPGVGTVEVVFENVDLSSYEGKDLVVYEELYSHRDTNIRAEHKDPTDTEQIVQVPKIRTTLKNKTKGLKVAKADNDNTTFIDTVAYWNLVPHKTYTLKAKLMVKDGETLTPLKTKDGNEVTEQSFTAQQKDGAVDVEFNIDTSELAGKEIVCYEYLYAPEDDLAAVHENPNDRDQTVRIPKVETEMLSDTGLKMIMAGKAHTLKDTIKCSNLEKGLTYTVTGTLVDEDNKKIADCKAPITIKPTEENEDYIEGVMEYELTANDVVAKLAGKNVISKVSMKVSDVVVGEHEDLADLAQTIRIPKIGTSIESETGIHMVMKDQKHVKLTDTVKYENLEPNEEINYYMSGMIVVKGENGKYTVLKENAPVKFNTSETSGTVTIDFDIDTTGLEGKELVCFETCTTENDNGEQEQVAEHKDLEDEAQTIEVPKIRTKIESETGLQMVKQGVGGTLTDTVSYSNLIPGMTYTMKGVLMVKDPEGVYEEEGQEVRAESEPFTPEESSGTVEVKFNIKADDMEGKELVCFETCVVDNDGTPETIAEHADLTDGNQTIAVPKIRTSLLSKTDLRVVKSEDKITVYDTVTYENLTPGKEYTMTGTLMKKSDGEPLVINGEPVTKSVTFTPEEENNTVVIPFEIDTTDLGGESLVAFEECFYGRESLAEHKDIDDHEQTIRIPKIGTDVVSETGIKMVKANDTVTLTDTVTYENLEPGTYTLKGILMDKKTGEEATADGEPIIGTATLEAEEPNGTQTVEFTFNTKDMEGKTLVVFEELYAEGSEGDEVVAEHKDIEDDAQTVHIPKICTTLVDANGLKSILKDKEAVLYDTIEYKNLIPNMKYKMVGTLMVKGTGKALIEDGKEVKAESEEFIPETPDGTVKVMFKIKNKGLANNLLVAFEECYLMDDQPVIQEEPADDETGDKEQSAGDEGQPTGDESQSTDDEGQPAGDEGQEQGDDNEQTVTHEFVPEVVAEHLDINDVNQTVGIPDIKTVLKTKNGKKVISKKNTTLKDTVKYTNLVPGTTYTMKATLMNKSTKKPVMNNGKPVTGTAKFTPKTPNGSVEVTMNVNVKNLNGKSLVAFEECYEKEVVIAAHKDLNDKDQTVKVKLPKKHKKHSRHPKTGDKTRFLVLLLAAGVIIVTAGGYVVYRRRNQKKMQ